MYKYKYIKKIEIQIHHIKNMRQNPNNGFFASKLLLEHRHFEALSGNGTKPFSSSTSTHLQIA